MEGLQYLSLREQAALKGTAAAWFHEKWGVHGGVSAP